LSVSLPLPSAKRPRVFARRCAGLLVLVAVLTAAGSLAAQPLLADDLDWRELTPESVRQVTPDQYRGEGVELVPMDQLYVLPTSNFIELERWRRENDPAGSLEAIVISNGVYSLERVARLLGRPEAFEQVDDGIFMARRPIVLAPSAELVIRDETLRLSMTPPSPFFYHGNLHVIDATITSWDEASGDSGQREELVYERLALLGEQTPRPYLLALRGSVSYFSASSFHGLGYQTHYGTYGISFAAYGDAPEGRHDSLAHFIGRLPWPSAVMVGNTVSDCYFGLFTNRAGVVRVIGNEFVDNVVYGLDPHDYSDGIVIARNLVSGTRFKHGIIISREVDNARIVENISADNAGSGIMLDRESDHAIVAGNVVYGNRGDGIAVYESHDARIEGNTIFANHNNGIYLRNVAEAALVGNTIDRNGHFGIEARAALLDDHDHRDLALDDYRVGTEASILDNAVHRNLTAAIAAKGQVSLWVRNNDFSDSSPQVVGGDLAARAEVLLRENRRDGFRYDVNGEEGQ